MTPAEGGGTSGQGAVVLKQKGEQKPEPRRRHSFGQSKASEGASSSNGGAIQIAAMRAAPVVGPPPKLFMPQQRQAPAHAVRLASFRTADGHLTTIEQEEALDDAPAVDSEVEMTE
jgi:hypothetical protein